MRYNFAAYKSLHDFLRKSDPKYVNRTMHNASRHLNLAFHNFTETLSKDNLPLAWYDEKFPRLRELSNLLKNVDLVDGRLVDVNINSTVRDEHILHEMQHFKALARAFLGHPSVQEELTKNMNASVAGKKCTPAICFTKPVEREPMTINKLTNVCNFLNISAQQRKTVRFAISPQVTQHRIFTGALEKILKGLKSEIKLLDSSQPSRATFMGRQIVSTCLKFLEETATRQDEVASTWMRPKPSKVARASSSSRKWKEVLEMFEDLVNCLRAEKRLSYHVSKLEVMKEGLSQIKDVLIDRDIGFKEVKLHESLIQKKLVKTLGHPSQCLFTLLRYYLNESVRDIEVEVSGGLCEIGDKDKLYLCMGKFLTSLEEKMIWSGIRQLDRALGLFKFVWDTSGMERTLELQGHLWYVGDESKIITYRGNTFFIHGIHL